MASFLKLSILPTPTSFRKTVIYASLPARDTVIDFGKYKGRMLGTLPSTYLKWVSNNLRARDFEEWAHLADQVLEDPVYNDRVEWECADKLLNGNALAAKSKTLGEVSELIELSQRFGWDNEDKVGWSKVDFQMLGTSKGGRIPRVGENSGTKSLNLAGDSDRWNGGSNNKSKVMLSVTETRIERRERLRTRRSMSDNVKKNEGRKSGVGSCDGGGEEGVYNPFPGRETLLRKVLNGRKIL